ncbi:MAG: MBOAT family protein [Clostridia bacterium]|nr:MBOAT family protein [Clostridia bacterium]
MSILSLDFLGMALAALILYYALPMKIRWLVLLAASGLFAALAGWQGAAHLAGAALLSWGGGLLLEKKRSRWILAVCLVIDIGAMAFIKYYPTISGATLFVPLGLSYFTFQTAGYLIDVYRKKVTAERNPLKSLLFAGYFLQLPQGPISTWKELGSQLTEGHRLDPDNIASGFQRMVWGYFKKMVLADRLAVMTDALLKGEDMPGWFVLGGVVLYAIRLYADFSGGLDIVRGISRMFGVRLPENFRRPFFADSVADYWRRWHITLGTWFRSYLLYPLVTSKAAVAFTKAVTPVFGKKTARALPTAFATLLVFVLIGIWHMASWNAVIFGTYFGLVMAISLLLEPMWKKINKGLHLPKKGWLLPFKLIRTWILVLIAQYFAFTFEPAQAWSLLQQTFANWDFTGFAERCETVMPVLEWIIAGSAAVILLVIDIITEIKNNFCDGLAKPKWFWIRWPALIVLIVAIAVFGCYGEGFDSASFVYTQF